MIDFNSIISQVHAIWAEEASCFVIEVGYASSGPEIIIGPFATPQEAMVFDGELKDRHAETMPDDEPLTTTIRTVHPATLEGKP